jgi:hypothetical protein
MIHQVLQMWDQIRDTNHQTLAKKIYIPLIWRMYKGIREKKEFKEHQVNIN